MNKEYYSVSRIENNIAILELPDETFKEVKKNLSQVRDISSSTMIVEEVTKMIKGKNEKKGKKKI